MTPLIAALFMIIFVPTAVTAIEVMKCRKTQEKTNVLIEELLKKKG